MTVVRFHPMTNRDQIWTAIRAAPGLTDAELRVQTGVEPHQQVNQICRRLEHEGLITRTVGPSGHIVNRPVTGRSALVTQPASPPTKPAASPTGGPTLAAPKGWPRTAAVSETSSHADARLNLPPATESLVLFPCSGHKTPGGGQSRGPSVLDALSVDLAQRLRTARERLAPAAGLDELALLPAWQRYSGTLYRTAAPAIGAAADSGQPMAILSGGYGLVLPTEPIGLYDRAFSLADWPRGLLQECLVALGHELHRREVVAFCARTTGYAELVRSTKWARQQLQARLVSPILTTRGGAQVLVPQALGTAMTAYLAGGTIAERADTHTMQIEVLR